MITELREKTRYDPLCLWVHFVLNGWTDVPSPHCIYQVLRWEGLLERRSGPCCKKHKRRYEMPMPGDRVQIDIKYVSCRIRKDQYFQYTAIDDCTRYRVAEIYLEMCNSNSKEFLLTVIRQMLFPIRCLQTDNDSTFTNCYTGDPKTAPDKPVKIHAFTRSCHEHDIEHILIKSGQPQLNRKVERSHQCDEDEFYCSFEAKSLQQIRERFHQWLYFYNHQRPHSCLGYLTPVKRLAQRLAWNEQNNWIWCQPNLTSSQAEAECASRAATGRFPPVARSKILDTQTQ